MKIATSGAVRRMDKTATERMISPAFWMLSTPVFPSCIILFAVSKRVEPIAA